MFAFCAVLVGLRYFAQMYLSFLLVGHTHEDIDQRFSVISGTLKRQDIDSMQELLELIKNGHLILKHLQPQGTWSMCGIGRNLSLLTCIVD